MQPPIGKFALGKIIKTPEVSKCIATKDILPSLCRHINGDWGIASDSVKENNETALVSGGSISSFYNTKSRIIYCILTNADRTLTTVSLVESVP